MSRQLEVGTKIRLNVVALVGDEPVGKLLVCSDGEAVIEDLFMKVAKSLARNGIQGRLLALANAKDAHLPFDEHLVSDLLRDGEEVRAILTLEPEPPEADASQVTDYPLGDGNGPMEAFCFDDGETPSAASKSLSQSHRPTGDWQVENLAPKLREYISTRFNEVHVTVADPGASYITVTMRPHERSGALTSAAPVHYSIARIDVIEFERLCGRKIQDTRKCLDHFQRCHQALCSLLERGAAPCDYAPNMLPYKFRDEGDFESAISEADGAGFGQIEGFRPVIVIDSSGALGESLAFIKAALKRMLYSFLVAKSKFNMVKFAANGRAVCWEPQQVQPTAHKLREAEEWLDGLKPVKGQADFLGGMHMALTPSDGDAVYVLSSGLPRRGDVDYILGNVRASNVRNLPIHVIGVECDVNGELSLRKLAEENHGVFRSKRFDGFAPQVEPRRCGTESDDARLTIGGQMDILEVMIKEQEVHETCWLEEQKCANRLLLTSATQQPVPDPAQALAAQQRLSIHHLNHGLTAMQQAMETATVASPSSRGAASRRGAAQPLQRSSSHHKAGIQRPAHSVSGYPAYTKPTDVRRPSVANPWDRPGAYPVAGATPIRVSQRMAARQGGSSARGNSARRTPSRH